MSTLISDTCKKKKWRKKNSIYWTRFLFLNRDKKKIQINSRCLFSRMRTFSEYLSYSQFNLEDDEMTSRYL